MSLSQRVLAIKPSPTMMLTAKAKAMKAKGQDVIAFTAGEPDFDTPDFIKKAAINAIDDGFTKYTAVGGIDELKAAIIQKLKRDNQLDYTAEQILVSCGGKHALYNAAQALLEAGDEVIIPAPYWVSYPDQVILNDAKPVFIECGLDCEFKLSAQKLKEAITPKTKVVILNSPSNPTGSSYSKEELKELAAVIVEHKLICFSDEIYEQLTYDNFTQVSIASLNQQIKERTLVFNGASKAYSMTGWRMGFVAGPTEWIKAMTKIQSQVTSGICSITQKAALAAYLADNQCIEEMKKEFVKRRNFMVDFLNQIKGVHCFKPQGAFYVFPSVIDLIGKKTKNGGSIASSADFAQYLLDEYLVAVVPGEGFGAPGYIRLSYATSLDAIQKGLERIKKAIENLA